MIDKTDGANAGDAEPGDGGAGRTPQEVRKAALPWAFLAAGLFVALVICGWGFTSLILDDDVLPPGMPLWAGPTSLVLAALVTLRVGYTSTREVLTAAKPTYDVAPSMIGGFGTYLVHLAVLALFAAAAQGTTDPRAVEPRATDIGTTAAALELSPLQVVLRQGTGAFGIVVLTASIIALLAVRIFAVKTVQREDGPPDGMRR